MAAALILTLAVLAPRAEASKADPGEAKSSKVSTKADVATGDSRRGTALHRTPAEEADVLFVLDEERMLSREEIAAVFQVRMSGFPKEKAGKLAIHLIKLAKQYGFDPAFLLSLIHVESSFQVKVVSNKGAVGLMQVLPGTAQFVADRWGIPYKDGDLFNPYVNMTIGTRYLAYLRDKYDGYMPHFLAAYNAGPGRVDKSLARNRNRTTISLSYVQKISAQVGVFADVGDVDLDGSKKVTGKPAQGAPGGGGEDIGV